ncbi:mitochondrial import inner membrane translocase subunit Tim23-like [Scleropages formosus]|uniref:Mitochondrial import inner membrane translocase subunit Tim23-like n=1 Tax=Scleropages formosus TaxID=113540 RepID=A0A0P7UPR2_SCLFO|nr:mitochondrial import inner membrane translocase subunit Tim23-like [Scleropages formosus]
MSALSPYLNVDPRHVEQQVAQDAPSPWTAPLTLEPSLFPGAAFGTLGGLRTGLRATRDLPWSRPRNVQILNMVMKQGGSWANTLGCVALLYSVCGVAVEKAGGAEDDINTVAAGTLAGALFKSRGGLRRVGLKGSAWDGPGDGLWNGSRIWMGPRTGPRIVLGLRPGS